MSRLTEITSLLAAGTDEAIDRAREMHHQILRSAIRTAKDAHDVQWCICHRELGAPADDGLRGLDLDAAERVRDWLLAQPH